MGGAIGSRRRRQAGRLGFLLRTERELWRAGIERVAGVDEVGVGPLAGPVVAAAVLVTPGAGISGVDDSKKLTASRRRELAEVIRARASGVSVAVVSVEEVDRINIYHAALEAMRQAVLGIMPEPEFVLVDARRVPGLQIPQRSLVRGDARSFAIAAASIVAKVARDGIMRELDRQYPEYGFALHMGYATRAHLQAIERLGPCPAHRRSFAPVRQPYLPGFSQGKLAKRG
jgi:ribonuclease HII